MASSMTVAENCGGLMAIAQQSGHRFEILLQGASDVHLDYGLKSLSVMLIVACTENNKPGTWPGLGYC
jgi:hypothetical protein